MDGFSFDAFWERLSGLAGADLRHAGVTRGDHVFRQGDPLADVPILLGGLVKLYYVTFEGRESVKSFIADRGVFGSQMSYYLDRPSPFSAVCLEDSRVAWISYRRLEALSGDDAALGGMILALTRDLSLRKEIREYELLCLPAEERYRLFLDRDPSLSGRVTQADIARFLGVTPVALSRIKKRL